MPYSFFLERAIETFQQHSPMDPESLEVKVAVTLVFIIQTAPDIKKKSTDSWVCLTRFYLNIVKYYIFKHKKMIISSKHLISAMPNF